MRRGLLILLFVVFNFGQSQAQTDCSFQVTGQVFDIETKEPLPFVTILIEDTTTGTKSELDGTFVINDLCEREVHLVFSHVGYKSAVHHHDTYHGAMQIFLAPDEVLLESVIVESDKITGDLATLNSTKLGTEEFRRYSNATFADVASKITGVTMLTTGQNIAKPMIHGLHSNRVLIINNEVRHEFQNWGSEHAPEIDPSLYNSLEVIKGAGTVRYGPDALGGVILVNPPSPPLDNPFSGEAGSVYHTNGRAFENNLKLQKGFDHFSVQGQVSYLKQGDLSAADYILSNTAKEELSYAMAARYHLPKLDLQVDYSRFSQNLGILRGSITGSLEDLANAIERDMPSPTTDFTYELNNPRQRTKHDLLKARAEINRNDNAINLQYAYQHNVRKEFDLRRGANNVRPAINLELTTHSVDGDWKRSFDNGRTSVMGTQLLIQQNRNIPGTNTAHFVPNYETYRAGVFLIESYELDKNTFEIGGRFDYQYTSIKGRDQQQDLFENDLNFQNFTLTAGFQRKLSEQLTFNTNIGSAWRPPNVSELYAFGKHEFSLSYGLWRYSFDENENITTRTVLTEEDRDVRPEKGFKWIKSLNYIDEKYDAELTLFTNYIQNFINLRPRGVTNTIRGAFPFFVYEQSDALLTGADFSVKIAHNERLSSHLRANYLYARDLSASSFFVGLPPGAVAYEIDVDLPFFSGGRSALTLSGNYTFRQFQAPEAISVREFIAGNVSVSAATDDFDFLPPPEGYLLMGVNWSAEFRKLNFNVQVRNLLNTSYRSYTNGLRYFADETGRNITISANYTF